MSTEDAPVSKRERLVADGVSQNTTSAPNIGLSSVKKDGVKTLQTCDMKTGN